MASSGSRYSFSLTTFSPSGKLVQIEHALKAVSQGVTAVGIKATNGIVIASEKRPASVLVDESTIEKVSAVCDTIGLVYSGIGPDARVLVSRARKAAQAYRQIYKEDPPVALLVRDVAKVMQEYTQSGGVRPFGCSLLVAGWDQHNGHSLHQVDPSGTSFSWKATAIGHAMPTAKTFLEKRYTPQLELDDAIHTAILALKDGVETPVSAKNIDIGLVMDAAEAERRCPPDHAVATTFTEPWFASADVDPTLTTSELQTTTRESMITSGPTVSLPQMRFVRLSTAQKQDYLDNLVAN